jgi:hypothetical protein
MHGSLAGQPFDPRPQGQMFPFDLLGVGFAGHISAYLIMGQQDYIK